MREHLRSVLEANGGLIARRDHPRLGKSLEGYARRGELTRVLPGVYCSPSALETSLLGERAIALADPNAVLVGRSAAALTWWPQIQHQVPSAITQLAPQPGFRWSKASPPRQLITYWRGFRVTVPALTTLDLIPEVGGLAIDEALRRRVTTLVELQRTLAATPYRKGNAVRELLIKESSENPWSEAERAFHLQLRAANITDWVGNLRVRIHEFQNYFLDVAFRSLLLAFEIDGYDSHGSLDQFEYDRCRDAELAGLGWHVVRLPAALVGTSRLLDLVKGAIAARRWLLGGPNRQRALTRQLRLEGNLGRKELLEA